MSKYLDYSGLQELVTKIKEEDAKKVDKVTGKGLSTNDYTSAEKQKLADIAAGAEVNVQADWSVSDSSSDAFIKNKPSLAAFITKEVDNLTNYYKKSETYTQAEVNTLIGNLQTIEIQVVQQLPVSGQSNIIYLVPKTGGHSANIYTEYVWISGSNPRFEVIGDTEVDLSNYYTKSETNTLLSAKFDKTGGTITGSTTVTLDYSEGHEFIVQDASSSPYLTISDDDGVAFGQSIEIEASSHTALIINDGTGSSTKEINIKTNTAQSESVANVTLPAASGTLALTSDLPTKVSDLTNDAGYTTNTGTVTSVRVQATSPVVSSQNTAQTGTLNTTISLANGYGDTKNPYASKTKNYVLAAPSADNGVPSFRALVAGDIPSLTLSKISDFETISTAEIDALFA